MATLAPSAARRFAIAAPIPREPPVTTATLPANFCPLLLFICFVLSVSSVVLLPPSTNGPMPATIVESSEARCSAGYHGDFIFVRIIFQVPRCFQWNGPPLINTQLQLGGWCAEGGPKRFSGFPCLADRLNSQCSMRLDRGETVETVKSPPPPRSHP